MKRLCVKCLKEQDVDNFAFFMSSGKRYLRRVCCDCRNKQVKTKVRDRKEYKRQYTRANPHKNKAKIEAYDALTRGRITRENCKVCGSEKAEMHHKDYNQPLEIIWLCRKHHVRLHKGHHSVIKILDETFNIAGA